MCNAHAILQIFVRNQDQPNYFTFLMDRGELGITDGGVLTVCAYDDFTYPSWKGIVDVSAMPAELVTEYEAVTSAPKLPLIGTFGWSTHIVPVAF